MLALMLFNSYSCKKPVSHDEGSLKVLTTISPLYCFTINITGDVAHVENLLPSGVGPHEYSLSPGDAKRVAAVNGDPHIWLSPKNAIIQVHTILDALVEIDPDNRTTYERNAASYVKELEGLDREIRDEVQQWSSRELVSFHSAYKYLVRDYGLVQAAVIQETPEIAPSPKHIAEVIDTIKSRKISAIFTEPMVSHKIVDSLADDLNLQVYSLDTLETGMPDRNWYIEKMKMNVNTLKEALHRKT
jgi:ABC-type Zn uptake system ZnuABC Zn-binding protein ZnuA